MWDQGQLGRAHNLRAYGRRGIEVVGGIKQALAIRKSRARHPGSPYGWCCTVLYTVQHHKRVVGSGLCIRTGGLARESLIIQYCRHMVSWQ